MQISVTDAKAQLTELVRRAEAGDEIVLTRHGQPAARIVPIAAARDRKTRHAVLEAVRKSAAGQGDAGAGAQRDPRTFSTARTACRNDRRRYLGVDGDPVIRAGRRRLRRRA